MLSLQGIAEIQEEAEYPGFRVSIRAIFDKTRQSMKIDISTGDSIIPMETAYSFKLMFEDRTISIMAYTLETVLAEKIETIITRGVVNTRMRDFYDVYILTTTQTFDANTFRSALEKTVKQRHTTEQVFNGIPDVISIIMKNERMEELWKRYQKKYFYAADISWSTIMSSINTLAEKAKNS